MISLPRDWTIDAVGQCLEHGQHRLELQRPRPTSGTRSMMVVPGGGRSPPLIGALNGYVLTKWQFRGADAGVRPDAVRLLHPVPDRADPDGEDRSA